MKTASEIRWCRADESATIMRFIDEHWRRGHVLSHDTALFEWQYRDPADRSRLSVLGAWQGDRMTGMLGVVQAGSHVCGRQVRGAWLTLWYADPGEPGLGLRLLKAVFDEGFGLLATSGMNGTSFRLLRAMRFAMMDEVPRWVLPVTPEPLAALTGQPAPSVLPCPPPASRDLLVADWTEDSACQWDQEWNRIAPAMGSTGVWRDAEYVGWRYARHPRFQYRIRVAIDNGRLTGLSVTRIEQVRDHPATVLRVLELIADEPASLALAHDIAVQASQAKVAFADFYCTRFQTGAALEQVGFVRDSASPGLYPSLFQPLDPRPRPLNLAVWTAAQAPLDTEIYFTRSDGDQDRPN